MSIPILIWMALVFIMGASVGSFINVCVYRLPMEKSVFWPGSHCGSCVQSIAWYDNIPILSYILLGGRCRNCKSSYSIRYMMVELLTGLLFATVFYLNVSVNILGFEFIQSNSWTISHGVIPLEAWIVFLSQVLLISFLLTASITDLDSMEIPLGITVTGTAFGLIISTFQPWPFPGEATAFLTQFSNAKDWPSHPILPRGSMPWPAWFPLDHFPQSPWMQGLCHSLIGALVGTYLVRAIRFTFGLGRGMEGMGLGDADLMMMVGAFWGWQLVVLAFFLSVIPAFFFGFLQLFLKGDQAFPFGPSLAISSVITFYIWPTLATPTQACFFDPVIIVFISAFGIVSLLAISLLLRFLRPISPPPNQP